MLTALRRGVLKVLSLVTASVLTACTASTDEMGQARQVLSHYALASCLADAYPSEPGFTEDAQAAVGAYHFLGQGAHRIVQDEDTLEVLHDPYAAVREYILRQAAAEPAVMKQGGDNAFASCLQVLSSSEFETLVRDQDSYIDRPD